jgi:hypothetical protein
VLSNALALASLGWDVLPCYDIDRRGTCCSCWKREQCATPGKHPRLDHGVKGASSDEATIRRWFERQWPGRCNLGVAAGRMSGLVIVDVDPKHDGFAMLAALERELGPLPAITPRVHTGSDGLHIYLDHPADSLRIIGGPRKLGKGVDVLSDGFLAITPPSVTNKGRYSWLPGCGPTTPLAAIPPAWLERLRPARAQDRDRGDGDGDGGRGDASLPLGHSALEFLEHGAPAGEQRMRALAATRNLLARGAAIDSVIDAIWQGLERSPQEPGRLAWTRADAEKIVADLAERDAPPLAPLTRVRLRRAANRVWVL